MSIKRYDIRDGVWAEDGVGGPCMAEAPEGEFVRHGDHVAEVERLRTALDVSEEQRAEHQAACAAEVERLTRERDGLAKALADAIECVESWSAYASDYYREKHDLAGDLARLRAALPKEQP